LTRADGSPVVCSMRRTWLSGARECCALDYAAAGEMRRSAPHARAERTHRGAGGASFGRSWRGEWSTTVVSVRRLMVLALTGTALVGSLSGSFPALAQPASPQQGSAPPSSKPIPIPEIAQRAED